MMGWRRNIFKVPSSKQGKAFVSETARLFHAYADASAMECIALKTAMVFPSLILQKPFQELKTKDHVQCIERRMKLWQEFEGEIEKLCKEVRAVQANQISTRLGNENITPIPRRFAELMEGKVRAANCLLNRDTSKTGQPLHLEDNRDIRRQMHSQRGSSSKTPLAQPLLPSAVYQQSNDSRPYYPWPVIFEAIDTTSMCTAA